MAALLIALPAVNYGCSSPTGPAPPPGGGSTLELSYDQFVAEVEPVLVRNGCDMTGDCHGGGIRGTFELSPPGAKDPVFDFDQVALQTSAFTPETSPILTEPLALLAGGTPHSFKPFSTTADSDYVKIETWIMDGVQP